MTFGSRPGRSSTISCVAPGGSLPSTALAASPRAINPRTKASSTGVMVSASSSMLCYKSGVDVDYGQVVKAIDVIRKQDVDKIGLVADKKKGSEPAAQQQ